MKNIDNPFYWFDLFEDEAEQFNNESEKYSETGEHKIKYDQLNLYAKKSLNEIRVNIAKCENEFQLKSYLALVYKRINLLEHKRQFKNNIGVVNGKRNIYRLTSYFGDMARVIDAIKKEHKLNVTDFTKLTIVDQLTSNSRSVFFLCKAYKALLVNDKNTFTNSIYYAFNSSLVPWNVLQKNIEVAILLNDANYNKKLHNVLERHLGRYSKILNRLIQEGQVNEVEYHHENLEFQSRFEINPDYYDFKFNFSSNSIEEKQITIYTASKFLDFFKIIDDRYNFVLSLFDKKESEVNEADKFEKLTFTNMPQKLMLLDQLGVLLKISEVTESEISSSKVGRILSDVLDVNVGSVIRTLHFFSKNGRQKDGDKNYPFNVENYSALLNNLYKLKLPNHVTDVSKKLDEIQRSKS